MTRIDKTIAFVKSQLEGEGSGHDWWHIYRVHKLAKHIATIEKANMEIVELASLLHDISDHKFNDGDSEKGAKIASVFLKSINVEEDKILIIEDIIKTMSFKGGIVSSKQKTLEGMIVQDADRIDAIGAIGIARTFAYGGYKEREIYNPLKKPQTYESVQAYINTDNTSINHFYEKILLLKDLMNTKTGKRIAEKRHQYVLDYLKQFFLEWDCNDIRK